MSPGVDSEGGKKRKVTLGKREHSAPRLSRSSLSEKLNGGQGGAIKSTEGDAWRGYFVDGLPPTHHYASLSEIPDVMPLLGSSRYIRKTKE